MKIIISDTPPYFLDLDAPTIAAEEVVIDGAVMWRVWCRYCKCFHHHGPGDGHREAHCEDERSRYWARGYKLSGRGN